MSVVINLLLFILSIVFLWVSSGIIIKCVSRLSGEIHLSRFIVSFFVLGFLSTLPEITIGINSIINKTPDIFVGNLTGGSMVLFLLVIPLMAILSNGITLSRQLPPKKLVLSILTIIAPFLLLLDGSLNYFDAFVLVTAYFLLISSIKHKKHLYGKIVPSKSKTIVYRPVEELAKIFLCSVLIYFSSKILIGQTVFFAQLFNAPVFVVSFLLLSLGTNLPELVITIKSVLSHEKEVAFGSYVGSAAMNTLVLGLLTFINGPFKIDSDDFLFNLIIFSFGLILFYRFSTTKNDISRKEGIILLLLYLFLVFVKIFQI
jgi:cation:H+ antiporter